MLLWPPQYTLHQRFKKDYNLYSINLYGIYPLLQLGAEGGLVVLTPKV
jgi:hypothetical protein